MVDHKAGVSGTTPVAIPLNVLLPGEDPFLKWPSKGYLSGGESPSQMHSSEPYTAGTLYVL